MDIKEFYDKAVYYAGKLKEAAGAEAVGQPVCVMRSDKAGIVCGIGSFGVFNGEVKKVSAETAALNNLYSAGGAYAAAMVLLDMSTGEILRPDPESIKEITKNNIDNLTCMVVLSADEAAVATELIPKPDFFEGFGDAEVPESSGKEYASELEIADDNPFAAADLNAERKVVTLEPVSAPNQAESAGSAPPSQDVQISKEELLQEAKKRKKAAKAFFNFKKKY